MVSAASGKTVLADVAARCEVSGMAALPEELVTCNVTGKRLLPSLAEPCAASGRVVWRERLRPCELTGSRVLPGHLGRCTRTGKVVERKHLGRSALSADEGLATLLEPCAATGRLLFPDELQTSEVSGKRFGRDRAVTCGNCGRTADLSEVSRCSLCGETACADDIQNGLCRSCGAVVTHSAGRPARADEIEALRAVRPWVRRAWLVEPRDRVYVEARSGRLRLPGLASLLVFDQPTRDRVDLGAPRLRAERLLRRTADLEGRARGWLGQAR